MSLTAECQHLMPKFLCRKCMAPFFEGVVWKHSRGELRARPAHCALPPMIPSLEATAALPSDIKRPVPRYISNKL
jgi:hypothetical protein